MLRRWGALLLWLSRRMESKEDLEGLCSYLLRLQEIGGAESTKNVLLAYRLDAWFRGLLTGFALVGAGQLAFHLALAVWGVW